MVGLIGGGIAGEIWVILIIAWDGGGVASERFGLHGIAVSEKCKCER